MEPYTVVKPDPSNPDTHVIIEVRGNEYSVAKGKEQETANEIGNNLN